MAEGPWSLCHQPSAMTPYLISTLAPTSSNFFLIALASSFGIASLIGLGAIPKRSEEHTSELQSRRDLVCRLLLEKKKKKKRTLHYQNTTKRNIRVNYNLLH